jgi:hypothetical protein
MTALLRAQLTVTSTPNPEALGVLRRLARDKASQLSQEAAAAKAKGKGKGRKMRKSTPTSQLLEEFSTDLE